MIDHNVADDENNAAGQLPDIVLGRRQIWSFIATCFSSF
jgi:hypothetical protein